MRFLFRHDHMVALELDGRLILATERTKGFNTVPALEAVLKLSRLHDVFLCWRGHVVANPKFGPGEGRWLPVRTAMDVSMALHRAVTFVLAPEGTDYNRVAPSKNVEGGNEQLKSCGLLPYDFPLKILGEQILAAAEGFPKIEGVLSHPIYGETRGRWLAPEWPEGDHNPFGWKHVGTIRHDEMCSVKMSERVNLSPLSHLFFAFDLPPVDHCMLYTFLLGCLHSASLDHPRPVLLVDSQHPGRGKGEIGQVLSVLLDGSQAAIPSIGKGITDDLVAHLIDGHRVMAAQNVTGSADWNNEFFACLATDGNVKKRAKYDRYSTAFNGIVGMLSTVYGEASFHEDMITRAWRVHLYGTPCKLTPRPRDFVVASRNDLLREARDVHERAATQPYEEPPVSRFAEFEAAGAGAYSVLSGKSHAQVAELLREGYLGARGLRTHAICEAWKRWPEEFNSSPPARILSRGRTAKQGLEWARAFGRRLDEPSHT